MKAVKGIPRVQEMDRNVVKYPSDSTISDYGACQIIDMGCFVAVAKTR